MNNFYKRFENKKEADSYCHRLIKLRDGGFFRELSEALDTFTEVFDLTNLVGDEEIKFSFGFGPSCCYFFIYPKEKIEEKHKTKYHLVPLSFVAKMADNMEQGVKNGRREGDWERLKASPENIDLYTDKLMRRLVKGEYAAVACNAMILDHLVNKPNSNEEELK
jgi:hypothetical protein